MTDFVLNGEIEWAFVPIAFGVDSDGVLTAPIEREPLPIVAGSEVGPNDFGGSGVMPSGFGRHLRPPQLSSPVSLRLYSSCFRFA